MSGIQTYKTKKKGYEMMQGIEDQLLTEINPELPKQQKQINEALNEAQKMSVEHRPHLIRTMAKNV